MKADFLSLAQSLKTRFPDARIETDFFDLGGALLCFMWHDKMWEFEFQPAWGFGVTEVKEEDSFTRHQDFISPDFECAFHQLLTLIWAYSQEPHLAA